MLVRKISEIRDKIDKTLVAKRREIHSQRQSASTNPKPYTSNSTISEKEEDSNDPAFSLVRDNKGFIKNKSLVRSAIQSKSQARS